MDKKIASLLIAFTTTFVYFVTILPQTKTYVTRFFVFYFIFTIFAFIYYLWVNRHKARTTTTNQFVFILSTTALFWVGLTGWYFSPFFYLLYLLGVLYAFIFSPFVTFVFASVLSFLFFPNIGSIDVGFDIVTLLSLFSMVPITYFLQQEYLRLKESEKKVLILKRENQKYKNKVDEVLGNRITRIAVDLKQPINDIKQTLFFLEKTEKTPQTVRYLKKMNTLVQNALSQIDIFETSATGEKLRHTKKGS